MALDTLTVPEIDAIEVNASALDIIRDSTMNGGDTMVEISLLSLLFGVLTVLSSTSMYFLVRRGSFAQTNVRVLVLSTVLIYMSTGTYIVALIWNRLQANHVVSAARDGLFSASYDGRHEMAVFADVLGKQSSMAVISLEINWIIGDAIVWWRVCVIWRNNVSSHPPNVFGMIGFHKPQVIQTTGLALLEIYNPYLEVFGILSLTTNILATSLIAYKAWEHRRLVKDYFSECGTKSLVLKTLALLVESGSVYSTLMAFVIVYQIRAKSVPSQAGAGLVLTKILTYFVYGCLVPLTAIYPTIIVFLVAVKQSPIENGGLSRPRQAHGHDAVPVEGSAIVFHHSTFNSSAGVGTEGTVDGIPADGALPSGRTEVQQAFTLGDHGV